MANETKTINHGPRTTDDGPKREVLETDILIVGAGPAGLACAIHLRDLADSAHRLQPGARWQPSVLVIEKGVSVGAHILSGAVLDPRALSELIPAWRPRGAPVRQPVSSEELLFLTADGRLRVPRALVPPYLRDSGNYIVSLGELTIWLAQEARARGAEILESVAGAELVTAGPKVLGVRCGDSGIGKDHRPRAAYQPGAIIRAKVTVLAEGARGSLTKQLVKLLALDTDRQPQTYAVGVKEVWELPEGIFPAGCITHTLGFPLQGFPPRAADVFGGGFLYGLDATHLALGLVAGLDYADPLFDPHAAFNRWKRHPFVRPLLEKGKLIGYGAKAIAEGGWHAMPRYYGDGFCILGESAGFLNAARLKGAHLSIKSGMLAARAILEAWQADDFRLARLGRYEDLFQLSWAKSELCRARNWRAGYGRGLLAGAFHDLAQRLTGGRGFIDPLPVKPDHWMLRRREGRAVPSAPAPDGKITFDRVTDVFHSGANHAEDQPCHLIVPDLKLCVDRCTVDFGNPCQRFCPAGVYEWVSGRLVINPGNCVHCKSCDIKDPYENILWAVPEGGGGPRYRGL